MKTQNTIKYSPLRMCNQIFWGGIFDYQTFLSHFLSTNHFSSDDAFDFPGGTDGPERFCQEAHQTEPTRQHEQQGEEEDEELHDDETQSERQNKRQTLLQGETGRCRPSE